VAGKHLQVFDCRRGGAVPRPLLLLFGRFAEAGGFEPPGAGKHLQLLRPLPSTARPRLQVGRQYRPPPRACQDHLRTFCKPQGYTCVGDRPCRGRPIRSLVAEDRSAAGVRDRTGPEPRCSRDCSRDSPQEAGTTAYGVGPRFGIGPARRPDGGQKSISQHTAWAI
jgi:hypothetical protein